MSEEGDGTEGGVPSPPLPGSPVQPVTVVDGVVDQPSSIAWQRKAVALLIALIADAPPACLLGESFPVLFDVGVALALWLALGRSRLLVVALLIECIPGVGLAPTWTAYVLFGLIAGKRGGKKDGGSGR